jgi:hypothetical protein
LSHRLNIYYEEPLLLKGRHNSSFTLRKEGDEIISVDNSIIVNEMGKLLSREFVCSGRKKTAKQLNRYG